MNRQKVLTALFSLSVALNIFFLGVAGARLVHRLKHADLASHRAGEPGGHRPEAFGPPGPHRTVRDLVQVMGGKNNPRVEAVWQEQRGRLHNRHLDRQNTHKALTQALTHDPYSEQELRAVLQKLNDEALAVQQGAQSAVVQLAAQLTPQERHQLKVLMEGRDRPSKLR
jgi:uncharacterized membrane protein